MNIKSNNVQVFADALNNKNWVEAKKLSETIKTSELQTYFDKCISSVGLAIMHYYINNDTINDTVSEYCLHDDVNNVKFSDIERIFVGLEFEQIYFDSLVYKADLLTKDGNFTEALNVILDSKFYFVDTLKPNDSKLLPFYERCILLNYKINKSPDLYALKVLQSRGYNLSDEILNMYSLDAFTNFEESLKSMSDFEVKKDSVVFKNDVTIKADFHSRYIRSLFYPELSGIKNWIFKKSLTIEGSLLSSSVALEVKGDTKISGSIDVIKSALFFRANLEVGKYILTAGVSQSGVIPKFSCDGELKSVFIDASSKLNLKGKIHPNTLIFVSSEKDIIDGYSCHIRKEVKEKFWREESFENSYVWLKHKELFNALQEGENIFSE